MHLLSSIVPYKETNKIKILDKKPHSSPCFFSPSPNNLQEANMPLSYRKYLKKYQLTKCAYFQKS